MHVVAEVAARYAKAGYFTVIDGIVGPHWFLTAVTDPLAGAGADVACAILRPALPIAVERAAKRPSTRSADPAVIEQLWNGFAGLDHSLDAHVIDHSGLTVEQTVAVLDERLRDGALTLIQGPFDAESVSTKP